MRTLSAILFSAVSCQLSAVSSKAQTNSPPAPPVLTSVDIRQVDGELRAEALPVPEAVKALDGYEPGMLWVATPEGSGTNRVIRYRLANTFTASGTAYPPGWMPKKKEAFRPYYATWSKADMKDQWTEQRTYLSTDSAFFKSELVTE